MDCNATPKPLVSSPRLLVHLGHRVGRQQARDHPPGLHLDLQLGPPLHLPPLRPALVQAATAQASLSVHQVQTLLPPDGVQVGVHLGGEQVGVQVHLLQLLERPQAVRIGGEPVVEEAHVPQLLEGGQAVGHAVQPVEAQVELVELGQQAQLAGQRAAGQTVVRQVQGQQVLQPPDGGGDVFQLGRGR